MNQLQTFNHPVFGELQVLVKDGKEYFPAKDVAKILGYSNPQKAIRDHCRPEGVNEMFIPTNGGNQLKKFIDEGNLYRLVVRSKLPEAEKFERWVFDDVLPSIRKHGAYMTPETIEQVLTDPDTIIKLATTLKEERQKRIAAEKQLEEQKPQVLFANAVETSESSVLIGELAKILRQNGVDIGQNRLFEWLRNNGYLIKQKGENYNLPTQYSMDLGLFEIKKRTINNPDGSVRVTRTPKVTGKGQIYFVNKFLENRKSQKTG